MREIAKMVDAVIEAIDRPLKKLADRIADLESRRVELDELKVDYDGGRSFKLAIGGKQFDFAIPAMIFRQAWQEGLSYEPGDMVTCSGSMWHCNAATSERPDDAVPAWTKAVRRGRDGRNGEPGEKGDKGEAGEPGKAARK